MKRVSELTNEEFQRTFPITLEKHNPEYAHWYEEEKRAIESVVNVGDIARISHIGSSAVKGLIAKPMVDMLFEIDGCCNVTKLTDSLKTIGFGTEIFTRRDDPMRLLLGKGFSVNGYAARVFLLHVRYLGDWDELYFRDYLIAHPETALEYGELKEKILHDIASGVIERMPNGQPNGYSQAKWAYVEKITRLARTEFPGRYAPMRQNG